MDNATLVPHIHFNARRSGRAWFERLQEGQIANWDDLANKFTQHFSQQWRHISNPVDILNVTHRDNETIKDFITRFKKEGLNIGGLCEELIRAAFLQNVRCDDLIHILTSRDGMPQSWDAIMTTAKRWTPLTKSPAHIMYTEGIEFKKPPPYKPGLNTNTTRYCDYHEPHGHTTNQCSNLKDAIEEYVNNGKLEHLIKNIRGSGKRAAGHDGDRSMNKIKVLHANMIQGGAKNKKRQQIEQAAWKEEQVISPKVKGGANKKAPPVMTAVYWSL
ncbi:uncharacterized protein LOC143556520 [Bidens hawaiensis]|uniref:uncharacterized protein LOC143556520 n=1 Tax=Bidens hawaiensis TaxID=980011 RepID=UPI0040491AF0